MDFDLCCHTKAIMTSFTSCMGIIITIIHKTIFIVLSSMV